MGENQMKIAYAAAIIALTASATQLNSIENNEFDANEMNLAEIALEDEFEYYKRCFEAFNEQRASLPGKLKDAGIPMVLKLQWGDAAWGVVNKKCDDAIAHYNGNH